MPGTQRQHHPCLAGESRESVFRCRLGHINSSEAYCGLTDRKDHKRAYTHAIWRARVPSTRARSYLVIYGVVIRFWLACGRSPEGRISTFSWPSWTPRQKRGKVSGVFSGLRGRTIMTMITIPPPLLLITCQHAHLQLVTPPLILTITLRGGHYSAWLRASANLVKVSDLVKKKNHDWDSRANCLIRKREAHGLEMGWPQNISHMPRSPSAQTSPFKQGARNKHPIFQTG